MKNYGQYMQRCFELARQGEGNVSPNPLVGCVVLDKNGKVISEGFHAKYGEMHAERSALSKLKENEAEGGTVIVNLEPCCHQGMTPPCTDIIIKKGIKRVVISTRDANPIIAGNGINTLKNAGIEVIENVCSDEGEKLNKIFFTNMREKRTYIAIKTAATLDGKIAASNGSSKWITGENARSEVRNIRNRYDAIMTTSATVIADNPSMAHKKKIILDRNLKTDLTSKIYADGEIYVFYDKNLIPSKTTSNIKYFPAPVISAKLDLHYIFQKLYEFGIMSVLIEAGGHLNGSALQYCDKIYHFIAPKITGDNCAKSCFDYRTINDINYSSIFKFENIEHFEPDILLTYVKQPD